ncbi:MAG: DUF1573 domain-containing protein [Crocinitomicaceae bacterium]|nr:DUF1573 domain-containing protein [Crocinitomicaceae bacterium]MBK9591547.1 DUF1573 domain-containing protein [Crocinitomicaceae bacterium]
MNKKYLIIASMALIACGGDKSSDVVVNTGEQSSVVETTNPILTEEEKETMSTDAASGETTTIEYVETKHDFGNVFYPSENKYTFKFKNTGKAPLIIKDAKASCGCTVPNKPEEPIMPGEIGEMDVIFRPKEGQVGTPVTKEITVTANTVPEISTLVITANVLQSL